MTKNYVFRYSDKIRWDYADIWVVSTDSVPTTTESTHDDETGTTTFNHPVYIKATWKIKQDDFVVSYRTLTKPNIAEPE